MPHQQRLDKDQFYDAYNNSVYPNYSHFHIIAYNAASWNNCTSTTIGSKIAKWDQMMNYCSKCTWINK